MYKKTEQQEKLWKRELRKIKLTAQEKRIQEKLMKNSKHYKKQTGRFSVDMDKRMKRPRDIIDWIDVTQTGDKKLRPRIYKRRSHGKTERLQ